MQVLAGNIGITCTLQRAYNGNDDVQLVYSFKGHISENDEVKLSFPYSLAFI